MENLVSPPGGAMMIGRDADGNQTATFWPEGNKLPDLGTPVYNTAGVQVSYFSSRGWMPMPIDNMLLDVQPILVPLAEYEPFKLYEL